MTAEVVFPTAWLALPLVVLAMTGWYFLVRWVDQTFLAPWLEKVVMGRPRGKHE